MDGHYNGEGTIADMGGDPVVLTPGEPHPDEIGGEAIEFRATFPPIQSAISIGADASRLKLDVSGEDLPSVMKLAAFGQGKVLRVTVEIEG
jgi:hypothetical protein